MHINFIIFYLEYLVYLYIVQQNQNNKMKRDVLLLMKKSVIFSLELNFSQFDYSLYKPSNWYVFPTPVFKKIEHLLQVQLSKGFLDIR